MIVFHGLNDQAMKILTCWWVHDSAEVCKLVGAFLLNNLSHVIDKTNVGLYRDDGLDVFKSHSGPESKRKRKEMIKTFNTYNLSITTETNISAVNFLDTLFDLIHDIYKPYQKPNDNPVYINKNSNHPPTVLRQLAKSIRKRKKHLLIVDFTKNLNMLEKK